MPDDLVQQIADVLAQVSFLGNDHAEMCREEARAVLASGLVVPTSDVLNLAQRLQQRGDFGRDDTDYLMGRSDGFRDSAAELRAFAQQK